MRSFGLILLGSVLSLAQASTVQEYQLDNGLRLCVKEDHRAPVVVSQVWYRVGSSYETDGITGISHALEHMMFKGTHKYPSGEFSRIIAENGGKENAFTSRDYTAYYQELEKERLDVSFELEADRMRNQLLIQHALEREMAVIKEERRLRTEDKPQTFAYERFLAAAFTNSPYRTPVIGWMDDLEHLELEDLKQWYARWYAPNNALLVVVGDVVPDAVFALAKKHFGALKPSAMVPPKPRREVAQLGLRRLTVKVPAKVPYVLMGYKTPVLKTADPEWEAYALEVLAWILDGGNSARLARNLVRGSQVAVSAGVRYQLYTRLSNVFLLDGTPVKGRSPAELEQALRGEIERLKEELVSASELTRVTTQMIADRVFAQDSVSSQARQIGKLEAVGLGWRVMDQYEEYVRAVTPEQIQAVVRKYFVDERLTVAVLEPQPMGLRNVAGTTVSGGRHVD